MKKKTFVILILLTLLTVGLPSTINHKEVINKESITAAYQPGFIEGKDAPNFKLESLNGRMYKLSDFRGQTILLNFWASWCPPCKTEIPDLNEFFLEHKKEKIVVLSVNMTYAEKSIQNVKAFQNMYKIRFPVLLDQFNEMADLYGIKTIPTSFLIDATGKIQKRIIGPLQKDRIELLLDKIE